ncbi:MAG: zf-TFIIB domain-containing protein [Candidatus Thermoplasmatota archaeon]|nr:zf-TFIIB domain-containing protein [Candidatus Thermoplasmatota archaeon]
MVFKDRLNEKEKDCPRCWVVMSKEKLPVFGPDIEVDACPKCQGVWFDPGELSRAVGKRVGNYLTKHIGTKSDSKLVCPRCGGLMDFEYADDVEVDACTKCGGAWLDAGELEKLKLKAKEGFKGDPEEKLEERYEEMKAKNRRDRRLF